MAIPLIGQILGPVLGVVDKAVKDKDLAAQLKNSITEQVLSNEQELIKQQGEIVKAEAQGESWLQRNWRPILMLSIVAIVVNNYLLAPYLAAFGVTNVVLELPEELFTLMSIGVGGYVVGRSGEKIAKGLNNK